MNNINLSIPDTALATPNTPEPPADPGPLADYGFTHIHLSRKWRSEELITEEEVEQLQQDLEASGLKVLDVHGPHPRALDLGTEDPENRQYAFDRFRHHLKVTHALGGDAMVYHVPTRECDDAAIARYIDGLQRMEDEVRELGIVIALENHYKAEIDKKTFTQCFEKFDPEYIGFTFDPGHASISGNIDWLLENCMERLAILHLNDNNGERDMHWNPFQAEGVVDWDAVAQGIAKSPYTKPLQLEVYWREDKHDSRLEFLEVAAEGAQKLQEQISQMREEALV